MSFNKDGKKKTEELLKHGNKKNFSKSNFEIQILESEERSKEEIGQTKTDVSNGVLETENAQDT